MDRELYNKGIGWCELSNIGHELGEVRCFKKIEFLFKIYLISWTLHWSGGDRCGAARCWDEKLERVNIYRRGTNIWITWTAQAPTAQKLRNWRQLAEKIFAAIAASTNQQNLRHPRNSFWCNRYPPSFNHFRFVYISYQMNYLFAFQEVIEICAQIDFFLLSAEKKGINGDLDDLCFDSYLRLHFAFWSEFDLESK